MIGVLWIENKREQKEGTYWFPELLSPFSLFILLFGALIVVISGVVHFHGRRWDQVTRRALLDTKLLGPSTKDFFLCGFLEYGDGYHQ